MSSAGRPSTAAAATPARSPPPAWRPPCGRAFGTPSAHARSPDAAWRSVAWAAAAAHRCTPPQSWPRNGCRRRGWRPRHGSTPAPAPAGRVRRRWRSWRERSRRAAGMASVPGVANALVCAVVPGEGRAQLESYLRDREVSFELIEHAHSESAAAEARAAHLPAEQTAKTVVLHTPDGYRFAVIPASDRLDLNKAAAALDVSRHQLRLASEEDLASDFAGYEVGALPPVGPDAPAELIDTRLL